MFHCPGLGGAGRRYQLIPQFDIDLLAEQHRLRVKVRELRQVELLGLDAQVGPLRVAPHLPAGMALVAVRRRGRCFVSRGPRDDGRRVLLGRRVLRHSFLPPNRADTRPRYLGSQRRRRKRRRRTPDEIYLNAGTSEGRLWWRNPRLLK